MSATEHRKLGDMLTKDMVGNCQAATATHYDGCVRKLLYSDTETLFPDGMGKIVSITDPEGFITHANSSFVHMSGYSREELIGAPHYILRHPDMPKAAFKGMWDTLAEAGEWEGYVKNLRKDGGFYWVFASVFSLRRNGQLVGYTSSRSAAPRDKVTEYAKIYREMLIMEQGKGSSV